MNKLRKPVYFAAGYNTISFGSGRKEFHPKKPRPVLEDYINEAGRGVLDQINEADLIDEGVISNFMAARFNKQCISCIKNGQTNPDILFMQAAKKFFNCPFGMVHSIPGHSISN